MLTTTAAGRVWDYSHSVGRSALSGLGFRYPIGVVFGEGAVVYVLNRGSEETPDVAWNKAGAGARVTKLTIGETPGDEELLAEFGKYGDGPEDWVWPTGIAMDSRENIYVTDEWFNRILIFDKDGKFLSKWGTTGAGDGEFNAPTGIEIDSGDNVYIVDSRNGRVQKLTNDGKYLAQWGRPGSGDGELKAPWGVTVDGDENVYVVDYGNNRVQKFGPNGGFEASFGSYGTGRGELSHPTDVAVDPEGDVYVCDWANSRIQTFGSDGAFITSLVGDAQELSKWAQMAVDANADYIKARRRVHSTEPEWRFAMPMGVDYDPQTDRLFVSDSQRGRLQIYQKVKGYIEAQYNL